MAIEDFSKLIGGNLQFKVLRSLDTNPTLTEPFRLDAMFDFLKIHKFKLHRVPFYWDSFLAHPEAFVQEVKNIAASAAKYGQMLDWDFHHYHTSRAFDQKGSGYPAEILDEYPVTGDWERDSFPFWKDLLENKPIGCVPMFDAIADIISVVVDNTKDSPSTWGYEIHNEPKFTDRTPEAHAAWGALNQRVADRIRSKSNHRIVICEGNGIYTGVKVDKLEYLVIPKAKNIVYSPHRYQIVGLDREVTRVNNFMQQLQAMGFDIRGTFWGEWHCEPKPYGGAPMTYDSIDYFMKQFWAAKHGWTFWAFFSPGLSEGAVPFIGPNAEGVITLTQVGKWLMQAKKKYYG